MKSLWLFTIPLLALIVLLVTSGAVLATGAASSAAQDSLAGTARSGYFSRSTWAYCKPTHVAAYSSRVHVRCEKAVDGVEYFAVASGDAHHASRVLSVLMTAATQDKWLSILYDPSDISGADVGCEEHNCRVMESVQLMVHPPPPRVSPAPVVPPPPPPRIQDPPVLPIP